MQHMAWEQAWSRAKAGPIVVVFILGPTWVEFELKRGMGLEPIKVIKKIKKKIK